MQINQYRQKYWLREYIGIRIGWTHIRPTLLVGTVPKYNLFLNRNILVSPIYRFGWAKRINIPSQKELRKLK